MWIHCRQATPDGWPERAILMWARRLPCCIVNHPNSGPLPNCWEGWGVPVRTGRAFPAFSGCATYGLCDKLAAAVGRATPHVHQSRVAQIAGEVGYESEPAFNRAFKREFDAPPPAIVLKPKLPPQNRPGGRVRNGRPPALSV